MANKTAERQALLEIKGLKKHYPIKGGLFSRVVGAVQSLNGVTFDIMAGETLGIVGESGCGKSTLGRTLLRLTEPSDGQVLYKGKNIHDLKGQSFRDIRKQMQMVFQNPLSSLNPRMKIGDILSEPLRLNRFGTKKQIDEYLIGLIRLVGLNEGHFGRFPHELSGGQRQRVGIARALSMKPEFIVCDEAVSALDVSIQSQVINLFKDLQAQFGLTYMFISHDLGVIKHISDRIAVMYLGEIVEMTDKRTLFAKPLHPYTEALLSAVPIVNPDLQRERNRIVLSGDVPNPANPPTGCRFHTRCPYKQSICVKEKPAFIDTAREGQAEHHVACHFSGELNIQGITK